VGAGAKRVSTVDQCASAEFPCHLGPPGVRLVDVARIPDPGSRLPDPGPAPRVQRDDEVPRYGCHQGCRGRPAGKRAYWVYASDEPRSQTRGTRAAIWGVITVPGPCSAAGLSIFAKMIQTSARTLSEGPVRGARDGCASRPRSAQVVLDQRGQTTRRSRPARARRRHVLTTHPVMFPVTGNW
jgi:hypothetical protein